VERANHERAGEVGKVFGDRSSGTSGCDSSLSKIEGISDQ